MKINEFLINSLILNGVTDFFLVTGGAIIPTVDYIGKLKKEGKCNYYCFQHEQSAAMAAEGYYRASGKIACVLTTSGPGAQNLLNGVCGCWFDSIPAIFITGQTNTYETIDAVSPYKPKQVGFQECPVVDIFKPFTKYCERLTKERFDLQIESGFSELLIPRMGPILFDFPVDVQNHEFDNEIPYPKIKTNNIRSSAEENSDKIIVESNLFNKLNARSIKTKRPLVLIGNGARNPDCIKNIRNFIETNDLPFVVSWGGFDIIEHNHPNYIGHIGVYGKREANYAIQNCDLLIVFGSRLDSRQTGGKIESFSKKSVKIIFDTDSNEVFKRKDKINNIIHINGKLENTTKHINAEKLSIEQDKHWKDKCKEWKNIEHTYSVKNNKLTSYEFLEHFFKYLPDNSLVIPDQGGNLVWTMQSAKLKNGQNLFTNFGNSSMGYALPAAIGAYLSRREGPIYIIDGDGGFHMNIQDLHTIKQYNIPIKIIILNNNSYGIIKQFQDTFFDSRYIATSGEDYYSPNYCDIARAYNVTAHKCNKENYRRMINNFIFSKAKVPELFNVEIAQDQKLEPKLEFGNSLENMSPYLNEKEIKQNMFIEPESANIPKGWVNLEK